MASVQSAVDQASKRLTGTVTDTPRLDAEVLMCFVLGWHRARLFAHGDDFLTDKQRADYMNLVERRAAGEPVAYIRNRKEFLALEFYVDPRVLIPRPETELLVARAVARLENKKLPNEPNGGLSSTQHPAPSTVVDVGTGSGAVAIGIVKSFPEARIIATDTSADALDVARINAQRMLPLPERGRGGSFPIEFAQGSLLEPTAGPIDLVVANLPYLSRDEYEGLLSTPIAYEPRHALTDEADGLQLFGELFDQVPAKLATDGCVLLEIGSGQLAALLQLARERLPNLEATVFADYARLPRVLELSPLG